MRVALYCRVSTRDQNCTLQLNELRSYCNARKFEIVREYVDEGVSGSLDSRPGLNLLMADARKRKLDAVLVWRFDRFARSTRHLLLALEEFRELGIGFVSYMENIDTTSALGRAIFTIVAAVAELERNLIVERVQAGINHARARGKQLGRRRRQVDVERIWKCNRPEWACDKSQPRSAAATERFANACNLVSGKPPAKVARITPRLQEFRLGCEASENLIFPAR